MALRRLYSLLLAMLMGICIAAVAGALLPSVANAQGKSSVGKIIKKGQNFFDEQRYDESIQTLSAALMRPGTAKKQRIQIYKILAYNYIVLNRTEEADGAVRGLLVIDEEYELPETESPRFRDFFSGVRKKWEAEGKPGQEVAQEGGPVSKAKIVHQPPDEAEPSSNVSLAGKVKDPDAEIAGLKLFYRAGSSGKFATGKVQLKEGKFTAEIPGDSVEPPLVEYYVEASSEAGLPIATRGDAETPLRIAVADDSSVVESPWLWVPIGVAVAAAVIIPVALFASGALDGDSESNVTVSVSDTAAASVAPAAGASFTFHF
jgi:hypothetical protein